MMASLDVVEVVERRCISQAQDNDDEVEVDKAREEPNDKTTIEEKMIRYIIGIGVKYRVETPMYYASLNIEELID